MIYPRKHTFTYLLRNNGFILSNLWPRNSSKSHFSYNYASYLGSQHKKYTTPSSYLRANPVRASLHLIAIEENAATTFLTF